MRGFLLCGVVLALGCSRTPSPIATSADPHTPPPQTLPTPAATAAPAAASAAPSTSTATAVPTAPPNTAAMMPPPLPREVDGMLLVPAGTFTMGADDGGEPD